MGAEIRAALGSRPAYVSFDVDALDPAFAPGTGTPVPGGLTSREAFGLLRALAGARLAGMDVVEVAPPLDAGDRTATLAAHLLFEGLALSAVISSQPSAQVKHNQQACRPIAGRPDRRLTTEG